MEIGSWQGGTLFVWSQLSVDNAHLISLDLNRVGDSSELVKRFQGFMKPGQSLVCLRQDSHLPASLEAVKTALTGRELDFLFIDGDHTFDGVKQDFEMYSRFVKPGGWIAFHDIIENPAQPDYGVPAYWRELRDKYHCVEFVDERNPLKGGAGIGILQTPLEQRPLPDGRPALAVRADA
jgi:predicted O-methyltransferase YrrM